MPNSIMDRAGDYTRVGLEELYAYLNRLHEIASEGHVSEFTNLTPGELKEFLEEVQVMVDETIRHLETREAKSTR